MATAEQIAELRELAAELDDENGWTDDRLGDIIDSSVSVNQAASRVWYRKASALAGLVDVSESGSSRKLSDLHKNALAMGSLYAQADGGQASVSSGPIVSRIRRGFS
jgi:hypothetical protein